MNKRIKINIVVSLIISFISVLLICFVTKQEIYRAIVYIIFITPCLALLPLGILSYFTNNNTVKTNVNNYSKRSASSNEVRFDTTYGKGAIITELEKSLNENISYGEASKYASLYNTDQGTGAIIAGIKKLNKNKEEKM